MLNRRAALVGAAAVSLGGCATFDTPPQTAALMKGAAPPGPSGLPGPGLVPAAELAAVPFFPQTRYHCGPAALATVLVHIGVDTSPDQLADAVFLPAREGSLQPEMLAAIRRAGALGVLLQPQLTALFQEVAAGNPPVVLQNLGLSWVPRWHYAVLVGYDLAQQTVVLRSGTVERERMGFTLFERTWARGRHWAFAAVPPGRLPVTAGEADATQAAIGFERVASPAQADLAYSSVLQRWPDNALAGLGQGNTRFAAGNLRGAADAFERVALKHDSAAAWHNLAAVRSQLGETALARAAAERAVQRASTQEPNWRDAAERLLRGLPG